jgi:hypothetical protein
MNAGLPQTDATGACCGAAGTRKKNASTAMNKKQERS